MILGTILSSMKSSQLSFTFRATVVMCPPYPYPPPHTYKNERTGSGSRAMSMYLAWELSTLREQLEAALGRATSAEERAAVAEE